MPAQVRLRPAHVLRAVRAVQDRRLPHVLRAVPTLYRAVQGSVLPERLLRGRHMQVLRLRRPGVLHVLQAPQVLLQERGLLRMRRSVLHVRDKVLRPRWLHIRVPAVRLFGRGLRVRFAGSALYMQTLQAMPLRTAVHVLQEMRLQAVHLRVRLHLHRLHLLQVQRAPQGLRLPAVLQVLREVREVRLREVRLPRVLPHQRRHHVCQLLQRLRRGLRLPRPRPHVLLRPRGQDPQRVRPDLPLLPRDVLPALLVHEGSLADARAARDARRLLH